MRLLLRFPLEQERVLLRFPLEQERVALAVVKEMDAGYEAGNACRYQVDKVTLQGGNPPGCC
jgi:hypothetical protein